MRQPFGVGSILRFGPPFFAPFAPAVFRSCFRTLLLPTPAGASVARLQNYRVVLVNVQLPMLLVALLGQGLPARHLTDVMGCGNSCHGVGGGPGGSL